eukprot:TRINITY_DN7233_c0_g1_i1.p2 TRINITY_DN7233_c0_g1~~TRINITY_DN7233_c0_g1_i1.p2  ORF type:complete len:140 (-),score=41.98 TRINITY_DN7233_c0_g1_i1:224-643(-)
MFSPSLFLRLSTPSSLPTATRRSLHTTMAPMINAEGIKEQVSESSVVLYMKGTPAAPMCGFSKRVVDVLLSEGAQFKSHNVLADESLRQGIKDFSGWPTLPQLFIGGELVGGCDIVLSLQNEGELTTMLKKSGAIVEEE